MLALGTGGKGSTEPSLGVAAGSGRAQAPEITPLLSSRHTSATARNRIGGFMAWETPASAAAVRRH